MIWILLVVDDNGRIVARNVPVNDEMIFILLKHFWLVFCVQTTLHKRIHIVIEMYVLFEVIIHLQTHLLNLLKKLSQLYSFELYIRSNTLTNEDVFSEMTLSRKSFNIHLLLLTIVFLDDFITNLTI